MTEPLNRDQVIALLNSLGSERDEDVLAAARDVHTKIADAGTTWQDLLRPEADADETSGNGEASVEEPPEPETPPPFKPQTEATTLIGKLLAKRGISESLRQELENYKTDIAEGEFGQGDLKYLRAISKRLGSA